VKKKWGVSEIGVEIEKECSKGEGKWEDSIASQKVPNAINEILGTFTFQEAYLENENSNYF
jgi:hypothetical protein